MTAKTSRLRALLASGEFLYMPSATTPIEGRLAEAAGAKVVYTGGYATGASRAITEPLLTMDEQVRVAGEVARAVAVPLIADAGAGFGEPLHTMRTVREFAAAGVAGIHIEDQLFPKRAHYHKYVAHAVPLPEFVDKIRWACRERDRTDPDFVVIARSDTCRELGLDEAVGRVNAAAEAGADLGLLFPRNDERSRSRAAAGESAARLGAEPRQPRRPPDLRSRRVAADGLPRLHRRPAAARGRRAFHEGGARRDDANWPLHRHRQQRIHRPAPGDRGHDRPRRLLRGRGRNRREERPLRAAHSAAAGAPRGAAGGRRNSSRAAERRSRGGIIITKSLI